MRHIKNINIIIKTLIFPNLQSNLAEFYQEFIKMVWDSSFNCLFGSFWYRQPLKNRTVIFIRSRSSSFFQITINLVFQGVQFIYNLSWTLFPPWTFLRPFPLFHLYWWWNWLMDQAELTVGFTFILSTIPLTAISWTNTFDEFNAASWGGKSPT